MNVTLADTPKTLAKVAAWLEKCSEVAVDTESNSLYVYYEQVCLLQASSKENHAILDTLALKDLSSIAPIFSSKSILKIFHASEYDIMCLKRDFGFEFNHIFDTMIAARILGRKEVGLAAMLESELGVRLEKKYQKANWGIRPIPEDMLKYAIHDTDYLIELKDKLEQELSERNLTELAQEDFDRVCKTPSGQYAPETTNWWKIVGNNHQLTVQQIGMLQAVCEWRERVAKNMNIPVFKVMQNHVMLELCLNPPQSEEELANIKGMRKSLIDKEGKNLMKIFKTTDRDIRCIPRPPKTKIPCDSTLQRREHLRNWRKETGIKYDVPSDVILPRDIMEEIICKNPQNEAQLQSIMVDLPWRYRQFSAEIIQMLNKLEQQKEFA